MACSLNWEFEMRKIVTVNLAVCSLCFATTGLVWAGGFCKNNGHTEIHAAFSDPASPPEDTCAEISIGFSIKGVVQPNFTIPAGKCKQSYKSYSDAVNECKERGSELNNECDRLFDAVTVTQYEGGCKSLAGGDAQNYPSTQAATEAHNLLTLCNLGATTTTVDSADTNACQ